MTLGWASTRGADAAMVCTGCDRRGVHCYCKPVEGYRGIVERAL